MLEAVPQGIRGLADYEAHARARLTPAAWAYFAASAGDGLTLRANRAAWDALALWPRVLRPLAGLTTEIDLLGRRWPTPFLVAPMALQQLAHPDAELGMALAAAAQGVGLVLSMQASLPLEHVADAVRDEAGRGPFWFQLYPLESRAATLERARRQPQLRLARPSRHRAVAQAAMPIQPRRSSRLQHQTRPAPS